MPRWLAIVCTALLLAFAPVASADAAKLETCISAEVAVPHAATIASQRGAIFAQVKPDEVAAFLAGLNAAFGTSYEATAIYAVVPADRSVLFLFMTDAGLCATHESTMDIVLPIYRASRDSPT
ncbi:hypothetical protein ACJ4V0_15485 [Phreatobacter sp. HK31-P]